jgi:hypothetical protein
MTPWLLGSLRRRVFACVRVPLILTAVCCLRALLPLLRDAGGRGYTRAIQPWLLGNRFADALRGWYVLQRLERHAMYAQHLLLGESATHLRTLDCLPCVIPIR